MSEKVSFLHSPFTFAGIDDETFVWQALEDGFKWIEVMVPIIAETCDVIDVDFNVFDSLWNLFHNLLSNVGRLANVHR